MNSSDLPPSGETETPSSRGAVQLRAQMHNALAELHPRLERLFNLAHAEVLNQDVETQTSRLRPPAPA